MVNKSGVLRNVFGIHQIPNSLSDDPFTSSGAILWTRIHLSYVLNFETKETRRMFYVVFEF
jgi:hypothetical protein